MIGTLSQTTAAINIEEINSGGASCSRQFFVASENAERQLSYINYLGSNILPISNEEMDKLAEDLMA